MPGLLPGPFLWPLITTFLILPFVLELTLELLKNLVAFGIFPSRVCGNLNKQKLYKWRVYIARFRYILFQFVVGLTFYTFPFSEFVKNVDKDNPNTFEFNVIYHVAQLLCITVYMLTSFMDPGIIKPATLKMSKQQSCNESLPLLKEKEDSQRSGTGYKYSFEPIEINLSNPPSCYCSKCHIIAPFRAAYDDNIGCVARFDHHSNWIGNAIGANNHRFFFILLCLETFIFISAFCLKFVIFSHLIQGDDDQFVDPFGWFVIVFVMLYMFAVVIRTVPMFAFHGWYLSKNRSTYEIQHPQRNIELKEWLIDNGIFEEYVGDNVNVINYNKGFFRNWMDCLQGYKNEQLLFYGLQCVAKKDNSHIIDVNSKEL